MNNEDNDYFCESDIDSESSEYILDPSPPQERPTQRIQSFVLVREYCDKKRSIKPEKNYVQKVILKEQIPLHLDADVDKKKPERDSLETIDSQPTQSQPPQTDVPGIESSLMKVLSTQTIALFGLVAVGGVGLYQWAHRFSD